MTWILPKNLDTSAFVLATPELISDLNEQSLICAQSLLVRSKPTPEPIWLRKWRRDSWMQHLSGRILKPSLGPLFETEWTCSLGDTHASLSASLADASEPKTPATCGSISPKVSSTCAPEYASSRTSRGTSASDSKKSSENWKDLVTAKRGAYSVRANVAHPMRENGSSSLQFWMTPNARDWKDGFGQTAMRGDGKTRIDQLPRQLFQLGGGLYSQTNVNNAIAATTLSARIATHTTPTADAQDQHRTASSTLKSEELSTGVAKPDGPNTPPTGSSLSSRPALLPQVNSAWVETIMGLPIGWTDCGYAATA